MRRKHKLTKDIEEFDKKLEKDSLIFLRRIYRKMEINESTGCWLWKGCIDKETGYGQINLYDYKKVKVHRLIAYIFYRLDLWNLDLQACHSCDVRNCVNPAHIWIGTKSQNFKDSVKKGRWHNQYSSNLKVRDWQNPESKEG